MQPHQQLCMTGPGMGVYFLFFQLALDVSTKHLKLSGLRVLRVSSSRPKPLHLFSNGWRRVTFSLHSLSNLLFNTQIIALRILFEKLSPFGSRESDVYKSTMHKLK